MIPVTKPYLPSRQCFDAYVDGIYKRNWLTNNGPLLEELTARLEEYLGVENLLLVSNGTLALQIAYRALGISDNSTTLKTEAITTPFTFVATASSLVWEGIHPVYSDINAKSWCLEPENIESAITENTRAIVPVHVFGNACDVEEIDVIADKHKLKVVYDASHAFGVNFNNESLLKWGDASTLSFHATKLFHTIEGGAIVFKRKEDFERAKRLINFGLAGPEVIEEPGINAKMNEFQAAMGLSVLDELRDNLKTRRNLVDNYKQEISEKFLLQVQHTSAMSNSSYMPILLKSEKDVLRLLTLLKQEEIFARRYFHPSLNKTVLGSSADMPISEDIAARILCLPLYSGMSANEFEKIVRILKDF